jgi:N-acetyl-gamma-glutamyl-phosphate reductase
MNMQMDVYLCMSKTTAAVVGASGYSGIELVSILCRHPRVSLGPLFAQSSAGKRVDALYPALRGRVASSFEPYSPDAACRSDAVFIALPSGEAMSIVPELLKRGKRVIDLGGDFRLKDVSQYVSYYKRDHTAPDSLASAVYGLPEWNADAIRTATLLSNPGCYPTSAMLPLIPLLREGIVSNTGIVINSLSGVSGAGRSSSVDLSFAEVEGSVKAYKVGVHQHIPEIEMGLSTFGAAGSSVTFIPHLLPVTRGILTTIVAPLAGSTSAGAIAQAFERWYGRAPFVRLVGEQPAQISAVVHTNFIDIGWKLHAEKGQVIILSAIDNLVKGAAGQAVQNFNVMFGYPETEGLL